MFTPGFFGPEFIITIVAIGCVTSLLKTWINRHKDRNSVDKETFNRLAQAFMQHKREMRERIQNLEAIIAEEDETKEELSYSELEEPRDDEGRLTNDLQEKRRAR